jgi:anti-sigma regulatory factor (Ser/Thr protein kinase)
MHCEVTIAANVNAPAEARSSLHQAIPPPELDGRADDARLALSELVSNAVRHGSLQPDADTLVLVIDADEDHVRVEVEQPTSAVEVGYPSDEGIADGGYGLHIVESTADSWGHEDGPPGRVWFEFRRDGAD